MLDFIKNLPKWQQYLAVIVVLGGMVSGTIAWYQTQLTNAYDNGYKTATVELQTEHNKLIAEQRAKHDKEVKDLIAAHTEALNKAEADKDAYWADVVNKRIQDLEEKHNKELNAVRIANEADDIDDSLNPDTVRLLNEARGSVSAPSYYTYPFLTGSENSRADSVTDGTISTVLSRPEVTRDNNGIGTGLSGT